MASAMFYRGYPGPPAREFRGDSGFQGKHGPCLYPPAGRRAAICPDRVVRPRVDSIPCNRSPWPESVARILQAMDPGGVARVSIPKGSDRRRSDAVPAVG